MSDYLFTLWDGGGAVPPVLSVAAALVGRGHDVRVLADPVLRDEVSAAGAEHISWTTAPHRTVRTRESDPIRDFEARTPMGAMARARDHMFMGPADRFARDTRAELERRRPDAFATEMLLLGTQVAAEAAALPRAVLCTTVLPLPAPGRPAFGPGFQPGDSLPARLRDSALNRMGQRLWDKGLPALNRARAEQGLEPLAHAFDQFGRTDRLLVLTSERFDYPIDPLPPGVRYVGPRLDDPAWCEQWTPPAGDAPLVLVGLSSSDQDHTGLLQRIADALGRLPVRGLITTGPAIEPSELRAPANVTVVQSAPHSEVLRQAAAVVTHAGHGTVIKALAHGVPLVTIPLGRDQPDNAARVVHSGTGLRLRPGASEARIAAAVRRLLDEPGFRAAAGRMADAIQAELGEDHAAAELEALAESRPRARREPAGRRQPLANSGLVSE